MRKLLFLVLFVSVCAYGSSWAWETTATEVKQATGRVKEKFDQLKKLRADFQKKTEAQQTSDKQSYAQQATELLKSLKGEINLLNDRVEDYLKSLQGVNEGEKSQLESLLRNEIDRLNSQVKAMDAFFRNGNVFAIVDSSIQPIEQSLNVIESSAVARKQSKIEEQKQPPSNRVQDEDSGFAYGPYLLALLLLSAGAGVTWWLNIRLTGLERALSEQNQAVPQLSQQVDEALDVMWKDVVKLQQQGAANHQQDFANLTAEIERLRATMQTTRSQSSNAEHKIARRRGEDEANYAPRSVPPAAPRLVSATDYLGHAGGNGIRAKTAMLRPDVLQSSEDDGPYLLLPAEGQADVYNVIPAVPRFQSSQDYSHFSNFYDCDQPSSGEVFILQPARAVYDHATGQWKLRSKGRLQIS